MKDFLPIYLCSKPLNRIRDRSHNGLDPRFITLAKLLARKAAQRDHARDCAAADNTASNKGEDHD